MRLSAERGNLESGMMDFGDFEGLARITRASWEGLGFDVEVDPLDEEIAMAAFRALSLEAVRGPRAGRVHVSTPSVRRESRPAH